MTKSNIVGILYRNRLRNLGRRRWLDSMRRPSEYGHIITGYPDSPRVLKNRRMRGLGNS